MQAVERVLDEVDRACALPPRDGDGIAALESTLQAVAAAPAAGREVATPRKVATPREVATPVSCMGRAALRAALMESLGGPAADARRMVLEGFEELGFPLDEADTGLLVEVSKYAHRQM